MEPILSNSTERLAVLTGAGVSVASGIRPFRGPGGLWNDEDIESWATARAIERDPVGCWRAHRGLAKGMGQAKPNAAHVALASLEARIGSERLTVITQNIDGLHSRAGSSNVVEIHGSFHSLRCTRCSVSGIAAPPADEDHEEPPHCTRCGAPLRYDVVLFGEMLPERATLRAYAALLGCDVFLVVGTSGVVYPAAGFAAEAKQAGARTILVNLESDGDTRDTGAFDEVILGRAEELLPGLLGDRAPFGIASSARSE
ncbi:MAG: NAD-dependent deacylase [Myxococcales bacterium]